MLNYFLDAPRPVKRAISVAYDCLAITLALYTAWAMRLGAWTIKTQPADWYCLLFVIGISIYTFMRQGLYRAILRYMAHEAITSVFTGTLISGASLVIVSFFFNSSIPNSVPFIYVLTTLFFVGLPRVVIRNIVQLYHPIDRTNVIIYGAGDSGHQLAANLLRSTEFLPIAFIDDNPKLHGSFIRNLEVFPPSAINQLIADHNVKEVLLAVDMQPRAERLHIVRILEKLPVKVQTIPRYAEIVSGKARIEELRHIEIEDLLGRDPVEPNPLLMGANINNKVVMVTGAGGSIGSELCREILKCSPRSLVLFELNEFNLYQINDELTASIRQKNIGIEIIPLLGSIQNQTQLETILNSFQVDTIYHAAAYKHVPLVEQNLIEGIRNNLFGTYHCAQAAINCGVSTFVLISTDKAVRPTNIMGASKRLAEMVLQSLEKEQKTTRFCMVRFGNVLGSSGSVVPKFREQIQHGGPITVTHPDITRFFMTTPEAAQLVIQAGAIAKGGDVFVLDMGEPIKIIDLAKEMILISGLSLKTRDNPDGDIEIQFTGLRPGEKLYEELLVDDCLPTQHPRIMRAEETCLKWSEMLNLLDELQDLCMRFNYTELHKAVMESPAAFKPLNKINDLTYLGRQNSYPPLKIVPPQANKRK